MNENILLPEMRETMVEQINMVFEASFTRIYSLLQQGEQTIDNHTAALQEIYQMQEKFLSIITPCLSSERLQCGKGCVHCCSFRVEILPAEALHIAGHIGLQSPETMALWKKKLRAQAAYAEGKSERDYQRPCAFLDEEGTCQIYPVRPYKCRVCHSLDSTSCRDSRYNYSIGLLDQLESMVVQTYTALLSSLGLSPKPAEHSQALLLALADPQINARWLSGTSPFPDLIP